MLKDLKTRGFKLFVSSAGYHDNVVESIKRARLEEFFDLILGNPSRYKSTEKESHLKTITQFLGVPFRDFSSVAFFLGDSVNDMAVAKRNNVFAIGITTTVDESVLKAAGADAVIDKHEDLLNIVAP